MLFGEFQLLLISESAFWHSMYLHCLFSAFLQPAQDFGTFFSAVIDDKVSSPLMFLPVQEGNTTRLSLSVRLNGFYCLQQSTNISD